MKRVFAAATYHGRVQQAEKDFEAWWAEHMSSEEETFKHEAEPMLIVTE